ncbi:hypothetical protein RUM44_012142 [Polyplax serrata]|uniref:Uncharacterized protein n=1 Tax=Polyplax serrata TaxID=468196 RepID=A0ABR1BFD1_POLSC
MMMMMMMRDTPDSALRRIDSYNQVYDDDDDDEGHTRQCPPSNRFLQPGVLTCKHSRWPMASRQRHTDKKKTH